VGFSQFQKEIDDSLRVWSAVDVITQGDNGIFWGEVNKLGKSLKGIEATVNISDGEGSHNFL
jgi:hypothetical protein